MVSTQKQARYQVGDTSSWRAMHVPHIDDATEDDIPQLVFLLGELFSQESDFQPDAERQERGLRALLGSPGRGRILVARDEEDVVGMVSLLYTISTAEGSAAALLEDLIVRPDWRRRGLGARLLRAAVELASHIGLGRITLLTDASNADAARLYERHGFFRSTMVPWRLRLQSTS